MSLVRARVDRFAASLGDVGDSRPLQEICQDKAYKLNLELYGLQLPLALTTTKHIYPLKSEASIARYELTSTTYRSYGNKQHIRVLLSEERALRSTEPQVRRWIELVRLMVTRSRHVERQGTTSVLSCLHCSMGRKLKLEHDVQLVTSEPSGS